MKMGRDEVDVKITDRIKRIEGVESAYWDNQRNRLVVYYHTPIIALDTIKIKVAGAIDDAFLHNAVEETTLISLGR